MAAESGRLQAGQGQGKRGKGRQTAICASLCPNGVHNSNLPFPPLSLCVHWPYFSLMGSVSLYGELVVCQLVCPLGSTCVLCPLKSHTLCTRVFFLPAIRLKPSLTQRKCWAWARSVVRTSVTCAFLHCKRYLSTTASETWSVLHSHYSTGFSRVARDTCYFTWIQAGCIYLYYIVKRTWHCK